MSDLTITGDDILLDGKRVATITKGITASDRDAFTYIIKNHKRVEQIIWAIDAVETSMSDAKWQMEQLKEQIEKIGC